jgi:hypothetical protein
MIYPIGRQTPGGCFVPERQSRHPTMPDPFTGWLSHVGLLLAIVVSISASLAAITHHADRVLGSVLSMCNRVRKFRRERAVPACSRKRVAKRIGTRKPSRQGPRAST